MSLNLKPIISFISIVILFTSLYAKSNNIFLKGSLHLQATGYSQGSDNLLLSTTIIFQNGFRTGNILNAKALAYQDDNNTTKDNLYLLGLGKMFYIFQHKRLAITLNTLLWCGYNTHYSNYTTYLQTTKSNAHYGVEIEPKVNYLIFGNVLLSAGHHFIYNKVGAEYINTPSFGLGITF